MPLGIGVKLLFFFNIQRWARAYRDSVYHGAVDTNNGTEALNRVFKYKYLPKQKHMTLSHIICNITAQFLPALHYKYVFKNFKQSELYRSYNPSVVPKYLQGRPKETILHCLHRQAASNKFAREDVTHVNMDKFLVKGKKDLYSIQFGDQSNDPQCTCKDWQTFHLPCKHFFAVFNHFPEWNWEKLPNHYLTSPYLSADNEAVAEYVGGLNNNSTNSTDLDITLPDYSESPYREDNLDNHYNEIPRKVCFRELDLWSASMYID